MRFPTFTDFHSGWTGHDPYPWQSRLADAMLAGDIPELVDVPTGLGKTTILSAAVWALAAQVHQGGRRTVPQRIVHVVDRRRVVDDAHDSMARLAEFLDVNDASTTTERVRGPVATALARLAGPWEAPLVVQRVHGEAPDLGAWLRPTGCVVLGMTSHQLVSRLLFRGYGVSARTRSIHAGLLGVDSLLVVDEPHLSHQAVQTVESALRQQTEAPMRLGVPSSRTVLLGATVPPELVSGRSRITLGDDDHGSLDVRRRWAAHKPVALRRASSAKSVTKAVVDEVLRRRKSHGPDRRIGVMVNSVGRARDIHAALEKKGESAALVTSRLRGTDRYFTSFYDAPTTVSTQCLEVGVDISFDDLVTEACPFDVLVQRLGRLGRHGVTEDVTCTLVTAGTKADDVMVDGATKSVYGEEPVQATIRFLRAAAETDGVVDLGLASQSRLRESLPDECRSPAPRRATFHRGYQRTMATSYPTPVSDFPLEPFISGPDEPRPADVLVAWRQDVAAVARGCPPLPAEFVGVPISAVRAWLTSAGKEAVVADVAVADSPFDGPRGVSPGTVKVRRDDAWLDLVDIRDLRPGDTIVVASSRGGYVDGIGWDQASPTPVTDHAGVAAFLTRDVPYRRTVSFPLSSATVAPLLGIEGVGDEGVLLDPVAVLTWIDALSTREDAAELLPDEIGAELADLGLGRWRAFIGDGGAVFVSWPNAAETRAAGRSRPQTLDQHECQVAETVRATATALGLVPMVTSALGDAGRRHDEGKRHHPFQRYLGNLTPEEPWAKSTRGAVSRTADARYALAAGYETGWRHEGLSAAHAVEAGAADLTVHLIASHHGRARPLLWSSARGPGQWDDRAAGRFRTLNETYGPWGLAYLEAVLRLSDWHASAAPARVQVTPLATHSPVISGAPREASAGRLLAGLAPSPMTGWFAAAGLLVTAHRLGDRTARAWWSDDPSDLGAPRWRSTLTLEEIVAQGLTSDQWSLLDKLGEALDGGGFTAKNQRLRPADAIPGLIEEADRLDAWLAVAITQDCVPISGSGIDLALPAQANNANYIATARAFTKRSSDRAVAETIEGLLDPTAGWGAAQCDGGMDRGPDDDGVTGREVRGGRIIRDAVAPLVVLGMGAFGTGGVFGIPCDSSGRRCSLPLPDEPTDLDTLGALALGTPRRRASGRWRLYELLTRGYMSTWVLAGSTS